MLADYRRALTALGRDATWPTALAVLVALQLPLGLATPGRTWPIWIVLLTMPIQQGMLVEYLSNVISGKESVPTINPVRHWFIGMNVISSGLIHVIAGLVLLLVGVIPAAVLYQVAVVEYAATRDVRALLDPRRAWRTLKGPAAPLFANAFLFSLSAGLAVNLFGMLGGSIIETIPKAYLTAMHAISYVVIAAIAVWLSIAEQHLFGQWWIARSTAEKDAGETDVVPEPMSSPSLPDPDEGKDVSDDQQKGGA